MPLEENASNEVEATSQDRKSRSRSRSRSRRTSLTEVSSLKGESNSKSEEDGNKKDEEESRMTSAFGMVQSSKKDSIKSTENDVEVTNTNLNEKKKEKSPETEVAIREFNALPEGAEKFHKLSWPRLGLMLMVESVALGTLSIPGAYATLGLVPGLIITFAIALISLLCSYWVGQVKLRYPFVSHFGDIGTLLYGRIGFIFTSIMLVALLTLTTASHVVTGTIMFNTLTSHATCSVAWGIITALILFVVALPKSFHEFSFLAFIDFASIVGAVLITIIATGVSRESNVEWHAFLPEGQRPDLQGAFLAVTNIVFAFAYIQVLPSFVAELKDPNEYMKAITLTVSMETVVYALTGSLIYVFVGSGVQSPALLSASPTISKIAFGVALPVIMISGSINTTTAARYVWERLYAGTPHEYFMTRKSKYMWIVVTAVITFVAWLVASLIPFFSALLGIIAALFISSFTFIFPGFMYFVLLREGARPSPYVVEEDATETYQDEKKRSSKLEKATLDVCAGACILIGFAVLGLGTWASAEDIKNSFAEDQVGRPFSCN